MPIYHTTASFIEFANKIHNNFYSYSKSIFTKTSNQIIITCPLHGDFLQISNNHLAGRGCRKCKNLKCGLGQKSNLNQFIELSNLKHNFKYDYSNSNYINSKSPIIITCRKHGDFFQLPNSHLLGHGCYLCGKECQTITKRKRGQEKFENKAKLVPAHKEKNYNYKDSIYVGALIPIQIYCTVCKEYFWQRPNDHLNGKGCQKCGRNRQQAESNRRKQHAKDVFITKANNIHGIERYDYVKTKYIKNNEKVCIICNLCNLEFWQTPNSHLSNQGCPFCRESKGEKIIRQYLLKHNIEFKKQNKLEKCKNIFSLPFDFGIYKNKNLKGLIEFQGSQHYNPIEKWGGEQNLIEIKKRDSIKLNYCKQNNIPFLTIPYTKIDNIDSLLDSFLSKIT